MLWRARFARAQDVNWIEFNQFIIFSFQDFEYTPQDDVIENKYDWKKALLKDLIKNIPKSLIIEICYDPIYVKPCRRPPQQGTNVLQKLVT